MTTTQTKSNATELAHWAPWPSAFPWNTHVAQMLDNLWHAPFNADTEPSAELTEHDDTYVAEIDLPGVDRKHVTVDVTDRRLSVHASRAAAERTGTLRHTTRSTSGEFDFEITLPTPIDDGDVTAVMANGVLTVRLPKAATAKSTRIKIS
jgi:HSP20 family protein